MTCFVTRTSFRRRGISRALAHTAGSFARERGARALAAHPMLAEPGQDVMLVELRVGTGGVFAAAGLTDVSRPAERRS